MLPTSLIVLLAAALQAAPPPLGGGLTAGLRLHYSADGNAQPAWTVDSAFAGLALVPGGVCARVRIRRRPDQGLAEETRYCAVGDTLRRWNSAQNTWTADRPLGPGVQLTLPRPNGDTVLYSVTGSSVETISGRRIPVVLTTVLTVDSAGRPRRRLRERFAPALLTATGGEFAVADSLAPGGWRVQQRFELGAIEPGR